jgi:hypothetical protein
MLIKIDTIPHNSQRDNTLDDWIIKGKILNIPVSNLGKIEYNALLIIHGLIEAVLCAQRGISEKSVREFDLKSKLDDPGQDPKAPYHKEHLEGNRFERLVARSFGIDWKDYEAKQLKVCKIWRPKK